MSSEINKIALKFFCTIAIVGFFLILGCSSTVSTGENQTDGDLDEEAPEDGDSTESDFVDGDGSEEFGEDSESEVSEDTESDGDTESSETTEEDTEAVERMPFEVHLYWDSESEVDLELHIIDPEGMIALDDNLISWDHVWYHEDYDHYATRCSCEEWDGEENPGNEQCINSTGYQAVYLPDTIWDRYHIYVSFKHESITQNTGFVIELVCGGETTTITRTIDEEYGAENSRAFNTMRIGEILPRNDCFKRLSEDITEQDHYNDPEYCGTEDGDADSESSESESEITEEEDSSDVL